MTDKETCNNIMTMQKPPRINMDSRIDDILSSNWESFSIDKCCVCVTEAHSTETSE